MLSWSLEPVIGLAERHGADRLDAACRRAIDVSDPTYRTVDGILAAGTETDHHPVRGADRAGASARTRAAGQPRRGRVMTRRHHLETTLRALELSGMRETVEARLIQVRAGELGHLESFQVLCEDEIVRREAAALGAPGPSGPLRTERHHRRVRLQLQPQHPGRGDPRPRRSGDVCERARSFVEKHPSAFEPLARPIDTIPFQVSR
jgi:hypothetical protein